VAQVAARYGVTSSAVYKWIRDGRIRADRSSEGAWRVPAERLERGRLDFSRTAGLRDKLLERVSDAPSVNDAELAAEIVARRSSSDGAADQRS
jgi:excisionase family DNA binding protein